MKLAIFSAYSFTAGRRRTGPRSGRQVAEKTRKIRQKKTKSETPNWLSFAKIHEMAFNTIQDNILSEQSRKFTIFNIISR